MIPHCDRSESGVWAKVCRCSSNLKILRQGERDGEVNDKHCWVNQTPDLVSCFSWKSSKVGNQVDPTRNIMGHRLPWVNKDCNNQQQLTIMRNPWTPISVKPGLRLLYSCSLPVLDTLQVNNWNLGLCMGVWNLSLKSTESIGLSSSSPIEINMFCWKKTENIKKLKKNQGMTQSKTIGNNGLGIKSPKVSQVSDSVEPKKSASVAALLRQPGVSSRAPKLCGIPTLPACRHQGTEQSLWVVCKKTTTTSEKTHYNLPIFTSHYIVDICLIL